MVRRVPLLLRLLARKVGPHRATTASPRARPGARLVRLAVVPVLLVGLAGCEPSGPAPGTGSSTVRVMPMGDSITAGGGVTMGYKGYLLDKLLFSGVQVDYVGSQAATGPGGLRDRDHEGHSGWANKEFQVTAAQLVATHQPHVVVYHVGTNDIFSNVDPGVAVSRLRDVLARIYAAKPDVHVVVAKIVRMNVGRDVQMQQYNDLIPAVVDGFRTQGRRISLSDLSGTLSTSDLLSDGVHVTDGGDRKMADAFYPGVLAAANTFR